MAACLLAGCQPAAGAAGGHIASHAPTPPTTFAVCPPLRKPALRRLAAADLPPPPPPAGQPQPPSQPRVAAQLPEAAPGAKKWWNFDFNPSLWDIKIFCIAAFVLAAAYHSWIGNDAAAMINLFTGFVFLLPPWGELSAE